MNLESFLKDCAKYNVWANRKIVDWLKDKPEELLYETIASSYSSIDATVFHILYAENRWLTRMQGLDAKYVPTHKYEGTMTELLDEFLQNAHELTDYINAMTEEELLATVPFLVRGHGEFKVTRFEMIQQCINHSTYHRGQIVTIGRNVGITDAPGTDYILYLGER